MPRAKISQKGEGELRRLVLQAYGDVMVASESLKRYGWLISHDSSSFRPDDPLVVQVQEILSEVKAFEYLLDYVRLKLETMIKTSLYTNWRSLAVSLEVVRKAMYRYSTLNEPRIRAELSAMIAELAQALELAYASGSKPMKEPAEEVSTEAERIIKEAEQQARRGLGLTS